MSHCPSGMSDAHDATGSMDSSTAKSGEARKAFVWSAEWRKTGKKYPMQKKKLQTFNALSAPARPAPPQHPSTAQKREIRRKLREHQKGICPFCQLPLHPEQGTLDHIKPKSRGGTYEKTNLVLVHDNCNAIKGDVETMREALSRVWIFLSFMVRVFVRGYIKW